MKNCAFTLTILVLATGSLAAQSSNTSAGLTGLAAGSALSTQGGTGGANSSPSGSAPIEIQVLVFHGLSKIAVDVADVISNNKPAPHTILLEDTTSANQVALYQAVRGYFNNLESLHKTLQDAFSLAPANLPSTFKEGSTQQFPALKNVGDKDIQVKVSDHPAGDINSAFTIATNGGTCPAGRPLTFSLKPNESCQLAITFDPGKVQQGQTSTFNLTIQYSIPDPGLPGLIRSENVVIPLSGTGTAPPPPAPKTELSPEDQDLIRKYGKHLKNQKSPGLSGNGESQLNQDLHGEDWKSQIGRVGSDNFIANFAQPGPRPALPPAALSAAGTTGTTTTSSTPPPATPYGLQWMNGSATLGTDLKSAMTYASSTTQPTTMAFEILIETELKKRGIEAFTSTSALNIAAAADSLSANFGKMLADGTDISFWTNQCGVKPVSANAPQNPVGGPQPGSAAPGTATFSACSKADVVEDLSVANQMMSGYTTLVTTPNDGNGTPVMVDVLRGAALDNSMNHTGIPSLQVAVAAAGGSTKANNFFGLNLFYQLAPSYNAGVIATFELRDGSNNLIDSGARNVLYGYKKWNPGHIKHKDETEMDAADPQCTFCSSKKTP